jgi:hypothetical protein
MIKRLGFTLVAILMALATVGGSVGNAFAKTSENSESGTTVDVTAGHAISATLGRNGISIANSPYTGEFELIRTKSTVGDHLRGTDAKFVDAILTLKIENSSRLERSMSIKSTIGYVYFDLTKNEQALWNSKTLAIYGYNSKTDSWTSLPTRWVSAGPMGYGRLAAPVSNYSAFALGTPTPSTSS